MLTDFRGARGSNTGDDFHELWVTRQALRLLLGENGLDAVAVEGLNARDEAGMSPDTWDGVDCTLYFGGRSAAVAASVQIEQLKYSAANPKKPWTVARLVSGTRRDRSVIARLAKAWKGLAASRPADSPPHAVLISNQPVVHEVLSAVKRAARLHVVPTRKPNPTEPTEARLAYAAGLNIADFRTFASELHFEAGARSRFALEERVFREIAGWTDQNIQQVVTGLRQFVRQRMMPESAGELITRESVLLHFGASHGDALFPCPSAIVSTDTLVSRESVREAGRRLRSDVRYLCLHGGAGVGKTTALQEIEADLPAGSIVVKYDCYGRGRYLDPSALRHRPHDAFLQLTNDLAAQLKLPLLLSRNQGSDDPRLFATRLKHAAGAMAAASPDSLIVIAVDAADNAIFAASHRNPVEASFVRDFVELTGQPDNVRFIITARTGRLTQLPLPRSYCTIEIPPFSEIETAEHVARSWPAPESWVEDFHFLSNGIPRVQSYALRGLDRAHLSTALDRLRPTGKALPDIFRQQFEDAIIRSGAPEVESLCAGLIALPRPVPLSHLAAVVGCTEAHLADVCADLAPGIRLQNDTVGFADEDFEDFVRTEGQHELASIRGKAASRLLSSADHDRYAALNVASTLVSADRGADLLHLVEREPAPQAVEDPVLRRETELQRLRLAINVCREAEDVVRALRFVLIGAESMKTEAALRDLLVDNPDLAVRFAHETVGRLILSDSDRIKDHGPLLFHKLSVDADRGDAVSVREGRRLLHAWLQARTHHHNDGEKHHHGIWPISIANVSSEVEATLRIEGPEAALKTLGRWTPKRITLEVALTLPYRLIAKGRDYDVDILVADHLEPLPSLFLLIPLALVSRPIDFGQLACGLDQLIRRGLRLKRFFDAHDDGASIHGQVLDVALTACELMTAKDERPELVDSVLASFLDPDIRRIDKHHAHEAHKLDLLFRAYTLKETLERQKPDVNRVFEPRPALVENDRRGQDTWQKQHDREIMDITKAVFGVYAAVANALVNQSTDTELEGCRSQNERFCGL